MKTNSNKYLDKPLFSISNGTANKLDTRLGWTSGMFLKLSNNQQQYHEEGHNAENKDAVHLAIGSLVSFCLLELHPSLVNSRLCRLNIVVDSI